MALLWECQGVSERRPNRREIAAAATRQEILDAARRLFAESGYAATSLQQIAAESGVAVQTIYSSIGAKAAVLLALNDLIDEEAGVAQTAGELVAETSPSRLVAKGVHLTRLLNERCGDLIGALLSAAPSEPDAASAVADGMRRHEQGAVQLARRLAQLGALRDETSPEQAAAAFSMMTSAGSWRQLTDSAGWSFDETEAWLTDALTRLLLKRRR
jgi:AcrR family transcriptional regulator